MADKADAEAVRLDLTAVSAELRNSDGTNDVPTAKADTQAASSSKSGATRRVSSGVRFLNRVTHAKWAHDADLEAQHHGKKVSPWVFWNLAFSTLGVVYGDIGTSPLYVFPAIFSEEVGMEPTERNVEGVVSLIIWTITSIVVVKYALIVLYADDAGNGGAFALFSLLQRAGSKAQGKAEIRSDRSLRRYSTSRMNRLSVAPKPGNKDFRQRLVKNNVVQIIVRVLVVCGVGLIMGDGVLTPAISVVSAMEGIQVNAPGFSRGWIVGLSLIIISAIFFIQPFGTEKIGLTFSPIVFLWLTCNMLIGLYNSFHFEASIFRVISPHYFFRLFIDDSHLAWRTLGGVLLSITGAEALFADLGHFSRGSIQVSTFCLVWPSLILTYLGQAAYIIHHPENVAETYWDSLPKFAHWPMLVLATLAAIVASQALISAVFSIVTQAIKQGFFPRFRIVHTSRKHHNQVYIQVINVVLWVLTLIVVAVFQTSLKLGRAYGIAVILDMLLTTHFMFLVMYTVWRLPAWMSLIFYVVFAAIEVLFFSSAAEKIPKGGWFSLAMAAVYASFMLLWFWGATRKKNYFHKQVKPLEKFLGLVKVKVGTDGAEDDDDVAFEEDQLVLLDGNRHIHRTPGVAIYYSETIYGTPPVAVKQLSQLPVLHEVVVFLTNRFVAISEVDDSERLLVQNMGMSGFYHAVARYGYNDAIDQGEEFVAQLLQKVLEVLYINLKDALEGKPSPVVRTMSIQESGGTSDSVAAADLAIPITRRKVSRSADEEALPPVPGPADAPPVAPLGGAAVAPIPEDPDGIELQAKLALDRLGKKILEPDTRGDAEAQAALHTVISRVRAKESVLIRASMTRKSMSAHARAAAIEREKEFLSEKTQRTKLLAQEISVVLKAQEHSTVSYVVGRAQVRVDPAAPLLRRVLLAQPYQLMVNNLTVDAARQFSLPDDKTIQVGLSYDV